MLWVSLRAHLDCSTFDRYLIHSGLIDLQLYIPVDVSRAPGVMSSVSVAHEQRFILSWPINIVSIRLEFGQNSRSYALNYQSALSYRAAIDTGLHTDPAVGAASASIERTTLSCCASASSTHINYSM